MNKKAKRFTPRLTAALLLTCLFLAACEVETEPLVGLWEGSLTVQGVELGFSVEFAAVDGELTAVMDIPGQMAYGLPLTNISFDGSRVYFELDSPIGRATYDGTLAEGRISGKFAQGGAEGEFFLERLVPEELPYDTEEVAVEVSGEVSLAGTLSLPRSEGPHPAVILISGSGAQNRDEEIFGFKPFRLLADHLTPLGVAVLRCDDRGVGRSTGAAADVTTADLAGDVAAQMDFLAKRAGINPDRIGLLGHSEGSSVAGMVAAGADAPAFVILLGGPAYNGEEIVKAQLVLVSRAEGATEEEIARNLDLQTRIFDALKTGADLTGLKEEAEGAFRETVEKLSEEERARVPDVDAYIKATVEAQFAAVQSPWFRYFMEYEPARDLAKITCPLLAVWGEHDLQVPAEDNRARMEEILSQAGHPDFTLEIFPGANHLFQQTETGAFSEYAVLPKEFAPGFPELLSDWLLPRVGLTW